MKTLKATPQLVYQVRTDKTDGVPKGKVHVYTVQYRNFEIDDEDFRRMEFQIHDSSAPEPRLLARLVRGKS